MTEYHHLINSQACLFCNTAVYGGNEYGKSGHLIVYFHSFQALNDAFEVQFFSGLHFYTLSRH